MMLFCKKRYWSLSYILILLFSTSFPVIVSAQRDFNSVLNSFQSTKPFSLNEPAEQQANVIKVKENAIQNFDFAYRLKNEDLEIRFVWDETLIKTEISPSIYAMTRSMNCASNDPAKVLTVHSIQDSILSNMFNADWGGEVYFEPKPGFSKKLHCKMLSLYKEGMGILSVYFLFDKPSMALDNYFDIMSFNKEK